MSQQQTLEARPGPLEVMMSDEHGPDGSNQKYADEACRLAWLQAAASGPGKTLHLAVLLLAQCAGRPDLTMRLTRHMLAQGHVSRDACYDGLRCLEMLGLVTVDRVPGHPPHVALLMSGEVRRVQDRRDAIPSPSTATDTK